MPLSIITLTYNDFEELKKTVNTIPVSDKIESIIVNGGECKRTDEYLNDYNGKVINIIDEGISDAFNQGLKNTCHEYIMFLNSGDELINSDYIFDSMNILDNNAKYSFVHSNMILVDKSGTELFVRPPMKNIGRGMPYLHPTMIVRKNVFDKTGFFDKSINIAMDYDWAVKLEKLKFDGYFLNMDAPVKMDGRGKSVVREGEAIWECFNILRKNNYLNIKNSIGFIERYLLYLGRYIMDTIGLGRLLLTFKKMKHSR